MIVLGIDTETTGLDCKKDDVIEVGLVLYDTELRSILHMENSLLLPMSFKPDDETTWKLDPKITEITHITADMIVSYGTTQHDMAFKIGLLAYKADAFLAHNAPFDKGFVEAMAEKHGAFSESYQIPWIDTIEDLDHPPIPSKSLLTLAAYYGFVNPFPHRALTDVLTMIEVFKHYDPAKAFENATAIKRRYVADFGWGCMDFEKKKTFAKENGFKWDPDSKSWYRMVIDTKIDAVRELCSEHFNVLQAAIQGCLL